jgi:hypothetical protein
MSESGCGARSIFYAITAGLVGEKLNKLDGAWFRRVKLSEMIREDG